MIMGYIYCITNLLNNKRYVGKTTLTPEERFKEHCSDSNKDRCNKRPLYDAMNKYGVENFKVETLEYLEDDTMLSDREVYWIQELNTFGNNGYNASKGGDGKILYDYNEIIQLANLGYTAQQICDKLKCCKDTVFKVTKTHNVKIRDGHCRLIAQYDTASNFILVFYGSGEAQQWLIDKGITKSKRAQAKIRDCCNGKLNHAYNYIWKYLPEPK